MKVFYLLGLLGLASALLSCGKNSQTPQSASLSSAVLSRDAKEVEWHIKNGADVNAIDVMGRTPLCLAARFAATYYSRNDQMMLMVKHLLLAKANPNVPDSEGRTPLHWAAYIGRPDIAEALIGSGADVHLKDNDGKTPLQLATEMLEIQTSNTEKRKAVIDLMSSVSIKDSNTSPTRSHDGLAKE